MTCVRPRSTIQTRRQLEGSTHLEVLYEVVKYPETVGILRVLYVGERADLGGLSDEAIRKQNVDRILSSRQEVRQGKARQAHLERDVFIVDPHFQLLLSDDILLWPGRVIFPVRDQR